MNADLIQRKISTKARGLGKYRRSVTSSCLLVVADGSTAFGFLDLEAFDYTVLVPARSATAP